REESALYLRTLPLSAVRREQAGGASVSGPLSRRDWLGVAGAGMLAGGLAGAERDPKREPFGYMLNMSTIRGQKLTPPQQVDVAAKAGYDAVEPWLPDLDQFITEGGSLKDL